MEDQQQQPVIAYRATPDDWISIAHLNVWAYREFALELGEKAWPDLVRTLTQLGPAAKEGAFFVVRTGVDVLGSVLYRPPGHSVTPVPRSWASIDLLAVAPPARRYGLGSILVDTGVALALEDGAQELGAVVFDYQRDARRLFDSLGWHREQGVARRGRRPYHLYSTRLFG